MISTHLLRRMWDTNQLREPSLEQETIQELLAHIALVEDSIHFRYRIAYEVYAMPTNGRWVKREICGLYWDVNHAHRVAGERTLENKERRFQVAKTHVMRIGKRWHRVNVEPYGTVIGDSKAAEVSPLSDLPPEDLTSEELNELTNLMELAHA